VGTRVHVERPERGQLRGRGAAAAGRSRPVELPLGRKAAKNTGLNALRQPSVANQNCRRRHVRLTKDERRISIFIRKLAWIGWWRGQQKEVRTPGKECQPISRRRCWMHTAAQLALGRGRGAKPRSVIALLQKLMQIYLRGTGHTLFILAQLIGSTTARRPRGTTTALAADSTPISGRRNSPMTTRIERGPGGSACECNRNTRCQPCHNHGKGPLPTFGKRNRKLKTKRRASTNPSKSVQLC